MGYVKKTGNWGTYIGHVKQEKGRYGVIILTSMWSDLWRVMQRISKILFIAHMPTCKVFRVYSKSDLVW